MVKKKVNKRKPVKIKSNKDIKTVKKFKKSMPIGIIILLIIIGIIVVGFIGFGISVTSSGIFKNLFVIEVGSGNVISETRDVSYFNEVDLRHTGNIYVTQGESNSLTIEAEDNIIPLLITAIYDNKLLISKDAVKVTWINNTKPINIYITMKDINNLKINTSAKGNIISKSLITSDDLKLTINGSGYIIVETNTNNLETNINGSGSVLLIGEATNHIFNLSGSGDLAAVELLTENTNISISGSGNAKVNTSTKLNVKISGSGDILYTGNPKISKTISGSGSVKQI